MKILPEAFVIMSPVTWQFRKAQSVNKALSQAIQQVCERDRNILLCYLLDTRQNRETETKLVIAVLIKNEATYLQQIATQFQDILSKFPDIASKTVIMSAGTFTEQFAGKEFYVRRA